MLSVRDRSPLTLANRQIIADVLTWDTQRKISPNEVETIAISHDIVWVKLTDNRAIPLHVETFKAIRSAQLEQAKALNSDIEVHSTVATPARAEVKPTYNPYPIGWKGAAANWKAFQASGKKLHLKGDPMEKWRELEQQQKAEREKLVSQQTQPELEAAA